MATTKKTKTAPSKDEIDAFAALVKRVQLNDIQLLEAEVRGQKEFLAKHGSVDGGIEVALEIKSKGAHIEKPPAIHCDIMFQWQGFPTGGQEPVVSVRETYSVSYDLSGNEAISKETLKVFAENNATFNVWPFFRQSLHDMTLRMGLPAYTLPLLKPQAQG